MTAFRTKTKITVTKAGIITREDHPPAAALAEKIRDRLDQRGITACSDQLEADCDILIILGGDGTLLRVAGHAACNGIPVIGINMGYLGFLTELAEDEALHALDEIIDGTVTVERRMMLKALLKSQGGSCSSPRFGLNEIVISKGTVDRVLELN
ncbi:MAG: NAD(+)/NADH kinase, partial [Thermodesulfobacteriota bacterium]